MVLLNSDEYIVKMDKKEFSLWLSLLSTHLLLCLLVRSITTILTITLEKNTQISRFQFEKLSFCSSDGLGTFLYKKSHAQVKFLNKLSHRMANDYVNKTTSNWQGKVNLHYFFRINIPLHSRLT